MAQRADFGGSGSRDLRGLVVVVEATRAAQLQEDVQLHPYPPAGIWEAKPSSAGTWEKKGATKQFACIY